MPGPRANPSKPGSRYRGARPMIVLPASGCDLPPPKLPTGRRWTAAERKAWRELWSSPQASQWDESAAGIVAAYVVHTAAVIAGTAPGWQATEARQLADRLGLTPTGLASLNWRISAPGEVVELAPLQAVVS
jgi:hypothetical protein